MIVQKFGGIINFISRWKKGTSFFFTFSIQDYDNEEYLIYKNATEEINTETNQVQIKRVPNISSLEGKILIADDEEFILHSIQMQMNQLGVNAHNIEYCFDGKDALQQLKEAYKNNESFKLIILDFNMPLMGGHEASKLMKEYLMEKVQLEEKDLPPIIGLTGADHHGDKAGFIDVFSKPIAYQQLK